MSPGPSSKKLWIARLGITGGDGNRFDLTIRHRFTGPDTMTLTIEVPQPISIELVRARE
jgi:hypothetical protein